MHALIHELGDRLAVLASGGPKSPPSAPPAIPPIIINPFSRDAPAPPIEPWPVPERPPARPPGHPDWRFPRLA